MSYERELFSGNYLRDALAGLLERVALEVEDAPEQHVLDADIDEWVDAIVKRRAMHAPVLGEPWMEESSNIKFPISDDPFDERGIPGYRVVVHVPFSGDGALFSLSPSSYTSSVPHASVENKELVHVIEYQHHLYVSIKDHTARLIEEIEKYLRWVQEDIDTYNSNLTQKARTAIEDRRSRIERHREHLAATGLPVRRKDEETKAFITEAIVRRPAPPLPPATPDSTPIPLEPVLSGQVYEHILSVIRAVGVNMERSPATYENKDEEDRRQFFLATLNTHYQGKTTAEAFNFEGKTDLLVRYEESNLFIGECKFWSGAKGFTGALDQLFRYRAWRDTKLALIVFVRERDLTSIVEKGQSALASHPQFVERKDAANETELRAKMSWPGDKRRLADLNVFFVHTPTAE